MVAIAALLILLSSELQTMTMDGNSQNLEELRRILEVNLLGQAHGIWAALPHLKRNLERGEPCGALILFSSVLGQIGLPLTSAYCASKHGLTRQ